MKGENKTEVILQQIASGVNNLESKLIKDASVQIKKTQKSKSIYDSILDTLEKNKQVGGKIDERK